MPLAAPTWTHWQHQLLHAAGLPITNHNAAFLGYWSQYRQSNCSRNPIDISHRVPGSSRCSPLPGGRHARNYASRDDTAAAFYGQLTATREDFPHVPFAVLHEALLTGSPGSWPSLDELEAQLVLWGSPRFAKWVRDAAAEIGTHGGKGPFKLAYSRNVGAAWSALQRALAVDGHSTIVELNRSTANLRRIERRLRRAA